MTTTVKAGDERTRLLQFSKELADPDWSLSVPAVAKSTIARLLEIIEATSRTITTSEELEALPAGSVIRDDNGRLWEWEHIGFGGVEKALSAMGVGSMLAPSCFTQFPATVLHEPKES